MRKIRAHETSLASRVQQRMKFHCVEWWGAVLRCLGVKAATVTIERRRAMRSALICHAA